MDFLIRVDHRRRLQFSSLQGTTAIELKISQASPSSPDPSSIIYWRENQIYEKSTAVLLILTDLGGLWKAARIFLAVPCSWRDFAYRFIAANRYQFFGKRSTCRLPTPEEKARFLP